MFVIDEDLGLKVILKETEKEVRIIPRFKCFLKKVMKLIGLIELKSLKIIRN